MEDLNDTILSILHLFTIPVYTFLESFISD